MYIYIYIYIHVYKYVYIYIYCNIYIYTYTCTLYYILKKNMYFKFATFGLTRKLQSSRGASS